MIKITDEIYVAAEQIAEVGLSSGRDKIYVLTKSGTCHEFYVPYSTSAYSALAKFTKQIDEELEY